MGKLIVLIFEVPYLFTKLCFIELKYLIGSTKSFVLSFKNRVLLFRQRNTLLEYDRRAVLVNEFFKTIE